jgi:hypothetical protein
MRSFEPAKLSVLALASNPALGRATQIMLLAMGFNKVDIATPETVCKSATAAKPTFILFTPEFLTMPMEVRIACGCPCKPKDKCGKSLTVIFLRKKTVDSILMSKEMGFDGIIFADQSMERLHDALKTVYQTAVSQDK